MPVFKKTKSRKPAKKRSWGPEHMLQKSFFKWLSLQHSALYKVAFAVPNGVSCSVMQRRKLLDEGMRPGVSDLFIPWPTKKYPGLFIEMKWGKNTLTPEQEDFIDLVINLGYRADVCYTLNEAITSVNNYLKD